MKVKIFRIELVLDPAKDDMMKVIYEIKDKDIVGRALVSAYPLSKWTKEYIEEVVRNDLKDKISLITLHDQLLKDYRGKEMDIKL